jgi:uncharacterized damage-inducible protein DinB
MTTPPRASVEPAAGISFRELLDYTDYLSKRWMQYFSENPAALDVGIGGRTPKVRELVFHLMVVEQTFANLLHDNQPPDPPAVAAEKAAQEPRTPENLARLHQRAYDKLTKYVASASTVDLDHLERVGPATITRRKILSQVTLHSVHHWAQIAMAVRQAGFPTQKPLDIILTDVME